MKLLSTVPGTTTACAYIPALLLLQYLGQFLPNFLSLFTPYTGILDIPPMTF